MQVRGGQHSLPRGFAKGVSQTMSNSPVFFSENETEENEKNKENGKTEKIGTRKKKKKTAKMGKEKTNKHKEFWRDTPWFVSRLSRGHVLSVPSSVPSVPRTFCPLNVNFHINRPKRPGCPWDIPNISPGRSWGIPTTKFLYVIFLYRVFVLDEKTEKKKKRKRKRTEKNRKQHRSGDPFCGSPTSAFAEMPASFPGIRNSE